MSPAATQRRMFAGVIGLSLAAVGVALISQHAFGIQPCPWCVLQRLIYCAIAVVSLGGLVPLRVARRGAAALMGALALCGVAAALWQHFVAAASLSCNLTLADRIVRGLGVDELWPAVFAPYASCADAAVRILGVPYEIYSLGVFAVISAAAVWSLMRRA